MAYSISVWKWKLYYWVQLIELEYVFLVSLQTLSWELTKQYNFHILTPKMLVLAI